MVKTPPHARLVAGPMLGGQFIQCLPIERWLNQSEGRMQIQMPLRAKRDKHHLWDPVIRIWWLTPAGVAYALRCERGKVPVRYNYDSAVWVDRATGEIHSAFLGVRSEQ